MTPRTENAIRLAVACCIHQCCESPAPLTCLQDYLEGLRKGGWDDDSLDRVRNDVLRDILDAEPPREEDDGELRA